jgi:hypothetical protein
VLVVSGQASFDGVEVGNDVGFDDVGCKDGTQLGGIRSLGDGAPDGIEVEGFDVGLSVLGRIVG